MPRTGRAYCETGLYHVTIRGCGRQIIFEDANDRRVLLDRLELLSTQERVDVIAYCLMDNHVHLVLLDIEGSISGFMHRLCSMYARYFNERHHRSGHLFQGRYSSAAIESERYLLTVIRYVHDNPVKAGMAGRKDYQWSSYRAYAQDSGFVSRELVYGLIGGAARFDEFSSAEESVRDLARVMHSDGEGDLEVARTALGDRDPRAVGASPRSERDRDVRALHSCGLNASEIARVTGISRRVIARLIAV